MVMEGRRPLALSKLPATNVVAKLMELVIVEGELPPAAGMNKIMAY
jgi:hypothetical protein